MILKKKISNENLLMIVLAFMSFSIGIWSNYRQLWLENNGFNITDISKILSVALICSSLISLIMSFFSAKLKVKSLILLSIIFRSISMTMLLFTKDVFIIKTSMLLGIMCDVIFSIAFYPLLTFITKSDDSYRKKTLIDYFAKDIGVVSCGLLFGVTFGKYVFGYNTCLLIALLSSLVSCYILIRYEDKEEKKHKKITLINSLKQIFKAEINNIYLINQVIINISYALIFDLIMLILVNYIGFDVAITSVFIIVCNMLGTVASSVLSAVGKNYSIKTSALLKFGTRAIFYLIAFLINNNIVFIIAIVVGFITSRILEDKVTGTFLQIIDENNQLLYGNIRYFVACLGEGIGAFFSGLIIVKSFSLLFLIAAILTIIQTVILIYLSKLRKDIKYEK